MGEVDAAKLDYASQILYSATVFLTALSECVSYIHAFTSRGDWVGRYAMIGCVIFLVICYIPVETLTIFHCWPLSESWQFGGAKPQGQCADPRVLLFAGTLSNVFAYVWIMAMLFPKLATLKIRWTQNVAALAVVSVGGLAVVASLMRMKYISDMLGEHSTDQFTRSTPALVWTTVQVEVAIVCVCALTVRPLLEVVFPSCRLFQWTHTELRHVQNDIESPRPKEEGLHSRTASDVSVRSTHRLISSRLGHRDTQTKHARDHSLQETVRSWRADAEFGGRESRLDRFIVRTLIVRTDTVVVTVTENSANDAS
jgi:hypothetical protein